MSKPVCVLQSPLFTRSGYGDWAMEVAKSLLRYDKFDLIVVPTRWGGCPAKHHENELDDEMEKELFRKVLKSPLTKQPQLFIQISIPNEFKPAGKYNIGMTAGIETTAPPGEWIEGLNKMDVNFVLSQFNKDVFEKISYTKQNKKTNESTQLKMEKPMEVSFWGANTDLYHKTDEPLESVDSVLSSIPEDFCFLFIGQWTHHGDNPYNDRKDIGNLVKTFLNTFKGKKDKPALILKTSGVSFCNIDRDSLLKKIKRIKNDVGANEDLPNVYLLHGELNDNEMNRLVNHEKVKIHINFTHCEGFGHPLLISSLSGKPILVSNWSGHLDFLNKDYTNLLDGEVKQVNSKSVNQWIIKESGWFYVDYEKASRKMSGAIENYDKLLKKAESLRLENMEKFSVQAMDKVLHQLLDKYVPEFPVEQELVLPSLNLPKLKKVGEPNENQTGGLVLPKLKKKEDETQTNQIVLPKLKKVT